LQPAAFLEGFDNPPNAGARRVEQQRELLGGQARVTPNEREQLVTVASDNGLPMRYGCIVSDW